MNILYICLITGTDFRSFPPGLFYFVALLLFPEELPCAQSVVSTAQGLPWASSIYTPRQAPDK